MSSKANGRLSRIITTLLLLHAGYEYVPYASLEKIVEDNKDLYYKALRRTQITLDNNAPDWEPWLGFFLRCLKKKSSLAVKVEQKKTSDDTLLPRLSTEILNLLKEHERLTIKQIAELPKANQNTLKVRLRELVHDQLIQKNGKARATWYCLYYR